MFTKKICPLVEFFLQKCASLRGEFLIFSIKIIQTNLTFQTRPMRGVVRGVSQYDTPKVWLKNSDQGSMFKRAASEFQFIAITFILVVLLGARTFASLTDADLMVTEDVKVTSVTKETERKPASIPQTSVAPQKIGSSLHQSADLDLNCSKKKDGNLSVQTGYVQFKGKSCVRGGAVSSIQIVNKSNGYTASVFDRGSDKYQTDLIQLQPGENEILIRYENSGRQVEEIIRVSSTKI